MILAALTIWVLTMFAGYLNRSLPWKICPICVGVSGTWVLMTAGIISGFFSVVYKLPVAMLMGGTVVGIAFQGEKTWAWAQKSIFYWKVPFIVIGMPLAYFLFTKMSWAALVVEMLSLTIITYLFFIRAAGSRIHKNSKEALEIEEKMKNCC